MNTRKVFLLVSLVGFLSVLHLLADGIVTFSNAGAPPEERIYSGEWVYDMQTSTFQFINRQPCSGANFHAALYWGLQGTPETGLSQIGPATTFLTGSLAGTFSGGNRTILPTAQAGPVLSFQVRVWEGPYTTYEQAFFSGPNALVGAGPVFDLKTKDPLDLPFPAPKIGDADGWRGFIFGPDNVTQILVPEPSTIAIAIVGAAPLFFRRKSRG